MNTRKLNYFIGGFATVWASHATALESGFSAMQLVNVIIAAVAGGALAVRALMDRKETDKRDGF